MIETNRKYGYVPERDWRCEWQINIEFPVGYAIGYLPQSILIEEGPLQASLAFNKTPNGLNILYQITHPAKIVEPAMFSHWNQSAMLLNQVLKDHVIIQK
jgi:hypothetical protein